MSEETRDLQEQALALDPMDPNPETAVPDHAPGEILAQIGGDAFEKGKERAGTFAAPAGLALATASCGADDIARLSQRPGESGWGHFGRIVMENPGTAITLTLIALGALFGARNVLKAAGSLIADGAKATGRFLIAANERGAQKEITPDSLKNILSGYDESGDAPALSLLQPAARRSITDLERGLRPFFATLKFNDKAGGTNLYENIVKLAYAHALLQEIGDGTFAGPGAPAAAAVPVGRAPRPGAARPGAVAPRVVPLNNRRDDALAKYDRLWQALGADNVSVTDASGFQDALPGLMTTLATTYRLSAADQDDLSGAITTFLSRSPYYRPANDRHRNLLAGEFKQRAVAPARTRAATTLGLFPAGHPGAAGTMAQNVDYGRAETVDRVASAIDGRVPRRRRVRDTVIRGYVAPRGTRRGYVGDVSARTFAVLGNLVPAWLGAGMLVGAGEPVPVRQQVVDPPAIHGLPSPEAAGADSAAEGGKNASSTDAGLKASQDATERESKKIDLKRAVDMLKAGKNERGDVMSLEDRERFGAGIRSLEARLRELGVSQEEIDAIEGTSVPAESNGAVKVEESGALGAAVQPETPDVVEASPDAESMPAPDNQDASEPTTRPPGAPLIFE